MTKKKHNKFVYFFCLLFLLALLCLISIEDCLLINHSTQFTHSLWINFFSVFVFTPLRPIKKITCYFVKFQFLCGVCVYNMYVYRWVSLSWLFCCLLLCVAITLVVLLVPLLSLLLPLPLPLLLLLIAIHSMCVFVCAYECAVCTAILLMLYVFVYLSIHHCDRCSNTHKPFNSLYFTSLYVII